MSPEELLAPRYKVIAPYPEMPYEVGRIIDIDPKFKPFFDKWSQFFKKLHWYDERTAKDMPMYIKTDTEWKPKYKKDMRYVGEVLKPFKIIPSGYLSHFYETEDDFKDDDMSNLTIYVPATEEEYNAAQSSKQ